MTHSPVLLLTSSLLTDRMLTYSEAIGAIAASGPVVVWATSARRDNAQPWGEVDATVEAMPEVAGFREYVNLLRRVNEYAWDARLQPPSRLSMERLVRSRSRPKMVQLMAGPGAAIARLGAAGMFERTLGRVLRRVERSPEATRRLEHLAPRAVVSTNPFWFTEPAIIAAAQRQRVRTLAFIPSWDNVTTKPRMLFPYDGYIVWSESTAEELRAFYPQARTVPIEVVGAPQFDVFRHDRFVEDRATFTRRHGLRADAPIVTYAIGSPNFLKEQHGAIEFARRVKRGDLGDVQVLVRPHPIHDRGELDPLFADFAPMVRVQRVSEPDRPLLARQQSPPDVLDWVSTFRHSDVVVNLSSTVIVDAAIFDTPVVNLDFDPEPGQPNRQLVTEINSTWTHSAAVVQSGGVWRAADHDGVIEGVRAYLRDPGRDRDGRRWIVRHVCGEVDGHAGRRFGEAVNSLADAAGWAELVRSKPRHQGILPKSTDSRKFAS